MPLTEAQRAQICPTCRDDPHTAPGRYCAPDRCYCGHQACPAVASYQPRRAPLDNVHLIGGKSDVTQANPRVTGARETPVSGTIGGSETAPAGASTPVAPGPDHYVTPAVDRRNRG